MSTKLEELRRTTVGNIAESMGGGRMVGVTVPGEHRPVIRSVDPRNEGVKRRADLSDIPVAKIVADPDQPRRSFTDSPEEVEELESLSRSLVQDGQIQPVTVYWSPDLNAFCLISGERRWRAAMKANLPTLMAIVSTKPFTPGERLVAQISENLHRRGIKAEDSARAYRRLMELDGLNQTQLAERLNLPRATVIKTLALLDLPDDILEKVSAGDVSPSTAYQVSKIEGEDAQREMVARIEAEGLTRDETERAVKQVTRSTPKGRAGSGKSARGKASKGKPAPLPKERKFRSPTTGLSVVTTGRKGFDLLAWAETLREALEAAQAAVDEAAAGQGSETDAA